MIRTQVADLSSDTAANQEMFPCNSKIWPQPMGTKCLSDMSCHDVQHQIQAKHEVYSHIFPHVWTKSVLPSCCVVKLSTHTITTIAHNPPGGTRGSGNVQGNRAREGQWNCLSNSRFPDFNQRRMVALPAKLGYGSGSCGL